MLLFCNIIDTFYRHTFYKHSMNLTWHRFLWFLIHNTFFFLFTNKFSHCFKYNKTIRLKFPVNLINTRFSRTAARQINSQRSRYMDSVNNSRRNRYTPRFTRIFINGQWSKWINYRRHYSNEMWHIQLLIIDCHQITDMIVYLTLWEQFNYVLLF